MNAARHITPARRNTVAVAGSQLDLARHLVAEALTRLSGEWTVDGDLVRGPGTLAVRVAELHGSAPAHLDLGFVLNRHQPEAPVVWDCASGFGATEEEKLQCAVEI